MPKFDPDRRNFLIENAKTAGKFSLASAFTGFATYGFVKAALKPGIKLLKKTFADSNPQEQEQEQIFDLTTTSLNAIEKRYDITPQKDHENAKKIQELAQGLDNEAWQLWSRGTMSGAIGRSKRKTLELETTNNPNSNRIVGIATGIGNAVVANTIISFNKTTLNPQDLGIQSDTGTKNFLTDIDAIKTTKQTNGTYGAFTGAPLEGIISAIYEEKPAEPEVS